MNRSNRISTFSLIVLLGLGSGLIAGEITDCNSNGVDDVIDITSGQSTDCNEDLVPDECQNDCDEDGTPDSCEILQGAPDVDEDGLPDSCESDCNGNGVPDFQEIQGGFADDCDGNGVPDDCEYSVQQIFTSDGPNDAFGQSLAIDGDFMAVGSYLNVSMYRMVNGEYVLEQIIDTPCGYPQVDLKGDMLVVGSTCQSIVDIYIRSDKDDQWSFSETIQEDQQEFGGFGATLALDSERLVVGPNTDGFARPLRIYERDDEGQWIGETIDTPTLTSQATIAISGNTVAYGGRNNSLNIYSQNEEGTWDLGSSDAAFGSPPKGGAAIDDDWLVAYPGNGGFFADLIIYIKRLNGSWELHQWINSPAISSPINIDMSADRITALGSSDAGTYSIHVYELQPDRQWTLVQDIPLPETIDGLSSASIKLDRSSLSIGATGDNNQHGSTGSMLTMDVKLDCNGNGAPDSCDLDEGTSLDINGDLRPDECQCLSDVNQSGGIDVDDVLLILSNWNSNGPLGDIDYDGSVGVNDVLALLDSWGDC